MHKFPIPIAHDIRPERARSLFLRAVAIVFLGVALVPPVQEGVSLCYGQWCQVLGKNTAVRTPVLDSLQDELQDAHRSVWNWMSPQFQRLPWDPSYVLPIATAVMVVAMIMLKL